MLRIMTWNILNSTPSNLLLPGLKKLAEEHKPDVICLQEVTRFSIRHPFQDLPQEIASALGMNCAYSLHPTPYGLWWEGVGIYSRLPLYNRRRHFFEAYRAYLSVIVRPEGMPELTVACVHLAANLFRGSEASALIKQQPRERLVMAGDFNATPESPEIREIAKEFSYDGCPDLTGSFLHGDPSKIDYIWASRDLTISNAHVLKSSISDHLPLIAEVSASYSGK